MRRVINRSSAPMRYIMRYDPSQQIIRKIEIFICLPPEWLFGTNLAASPIRYVIN